MGKIIFITHGSVDKDDIDYNYIGFGRELACLDEEGVKTAETLANDSRLKEAEFILSSPYPRALETAAIISRINNLPLKAELGLHDWIPKDPYDTSTDILVKPALNIFLAYKGKRDLGLRYRYEIMDKMRYRVTKALFPYLQQYKTIIVVSHPLVAKVFDFDYHLKEGEILEIEVPEEG